MVVICESRGGAFESVPNRAVLVELARGGDRQAAVALLRRQQ
jgi:hypothetical protein